MRPVMKCVLVSALFALFLAAANAATPKTQKTSTNSTPAMMQMPMVVPLFLEDGDYTSTLVLVNGSAVQTYADVTVRALSGKTVATSRVQFIPHSQQQVNLRKLLDASGASGITAGSITVMQSASLNGMVITAALSMTRLSSSPSYIDEEIAMPSAESSQILRAVADKGEGTPIVAITSLSDMGQHVQVQCLAKNGIKFSKAVQLSAGETLLTDACSQETFHGSDFQRYAEDPRDEARGPIGIALKSDAMPGSFAAFALAPHGSRDGRYFSSVAFTDPMMVMSTTTVFTGVPVGPAAQLPPGTYTPTVALANFGNQEAHITVRYAQTSGDTPNAQDVESIVVPPQSSWEVSLLGLKGDPNLQNSFLIVADGAPGDVAAKLVARSDSQLREVELLGKDLKDPQNGGGHPWSIEEGTDSTLLLFNTTATAQHFTVMVTAGTTTWQKVYVLASMQTKAISVRGLIGNKVADDKGKVLPTDIWRGQIGWYSPGPNHGRGRILESNRDTAMARSFSCGYFSSICGSEFTPYTTSYLVGQTAGFGDFEAEVCLSSNPGACSGTFLGTGNDFSYFWQSSNPSVLSIGACCGPMIDLHAASVGSSSIEGNVSDGSCGADLFQTATAAEVQLSSVNDVPQGGTTSVTVNLPPTSIPIHLVLSVNGGGSATFDDGSTDKVITSSGSYQINGVTASDTSGNITLDAQVANSDIGEGSGRTSVADATVPFTVVNVALSLQTTGPIPEDNGGLNSFSFVTTYLGITLYPQFDYSTCGVSFQVTGTVTPADYTGTITLKRNATYNSYQNGTLNHQVIDTDDTSPYQYLDTDPQSGGSSGTVYDLDAPGPNILSTDSVGTTRRLRTNFTEYAVLGDRYSSQTVPASNLTFFARSSCKQADLGNGPIPLFDTSYANDNEAGLGTTALSENLQ